MKLLLAYVARGSWAELSPGYLFLIFTDPRWQEVQR